MDDLEQWLSQAQKGDKDAFSKIYRMFSRRIFRYCFLNLHDHDLAQDISQETFIKAWKNLPSFSHFAGGSFQAYLFKIAKNSIIDFSRKKKETSLEGAMEIEANEKPDENLVREETSKKVWEALSLLKEEEKQIVILRYFEELSFTEISKVLGIREGALRVKIHRVLKKMKEVLEETE